LPVACLRLTYMYQDKTANSSEKRTNVGAVHNQRILILKNKL
jgi:hypothetical protein